MSKNWAKPTFDHEYFGKTQTNERPNEEIETFFMNEAFGRTKQNINFQADQQAKSITSKIQTTKNMEMFAFNDFLDFNPQNSTPKWKTSQDEEPSFMSKESLDQTRPNNLIELDNQLENSRKKKKHAGMINQNEMDMFPYKEDIVNTKFETDYPPKTPTAKKSAPQSLYFSDRSSNICAEINTKRRKDKEMLANLKTNLGEQESQAFANLEGVVFAFYENVGQLLEEKLMVLNEVIHNIAKLEEELDQFKRSIGILYENF